jgi:hypothetical protein
MGCARRSYQPRHAKVSVLHGVIRDHLDDFLGAAADWADGAGLPEFIAREFRGFYVIYALMVRSPPLAGMRRKNPDTWNTPEHMIRSRTEQASVGRTSDSPQSELLGEINLDSRDCCVVKQVCLTQFSKAFHHKIELAPLHLGSSPLGGNRWLDPYIQAP